MTDLILSKISGAFTEVQHHRIAKIINLASTQAEIERLEAEVVTNLAKQEKLNLARAEILQLDEQLTAEGVSIRVTMSEYNHSVGLIMGKELWISAEPANIADLSQNVIFIKGVA